MSRDLHNIDARKLMRRYSNCLFPVLPEYTIWSLDYCLWGAWFPKWHDILTHWLMHLCWLELYMLLRFTGSGPECSLSNISAVALQEGDTLNLQCTLNHSGKFSPVMHWRIINGQSAPINLERTKYNEITTRTNVSLETTVTLNITSELEGSKFKCWIEFPDPSSAHENNPNILQQSDSSCFSLIFPVQSKLMIFLDVYPQTYLFIHLVSM